MDEEFTISQDHSKQRLSNIKKSSTGLKIACTLLSITVLALGAYLIYDKFFSANPAEQNLAANKLEKTESESKQQIEKVKHATGFAVRIDAGVFFITKDGDVYFEPNLDNLKATENCKNCHLNFTDSAKLGEKQDYTILKADVGNYSVVGSESENLKFSGYKLDLQNIVSCQMVNIGQQFSAFKLIFISQDGLAELAELTPGNMMGLGSLATFHTKQFTKAKDIVGSMQIDIGEGLMAALIGADGSHYILDDSDFPDYKE